MSQVSVAGQLENPTSCTDLADVANHFLHNTHHWERSFFHSSSIAVIVIGSTLQQQIQRLFNGLKDQRWQNGQFAGNHKVSLKLVVAVQAPPGYTIVEFVAGDVLTLGTMLFNSLQNPRRNFSSSADATREKVNFEYMESIWNTWTTVELMWDIQQSEFLLKIR